MGTEKQRGNSGARKSIARPRIMQRRVLARAECMNRITMAGVSMANKKKEINGCTTCIDSVKALGAKRNESLKIKVIWKRMDRM